MKYLATILFLIANSTSSVMSKDIGIMMGWGVGSCAEFAEQYKAHPTPTEFAYYNWAQGFMSARNFEQSFQKNPRRDLNGWQVGDQQNYLRAFCQRQPLSNYVEGVLELYKSLPEVPPYPN